MRESCCALALTVYHSISLSFSLPLALSQSSVARGVHGRWFAVYVTGCVIIGVIYVVLLVLDARNQR